MSPKSTRLALGLLFSLFLAQPVLKSQDVILQGFYWNTNPGDISTNSGVWWDTIAGIAPYLQNTGFETVWTPPANKGFGNVYDMGYGVYDYYDFGEYNQKGSTRTRHGNKAQLQNMISALHGNGIKVMADLVLNHRGGGDALEPEDCNDGVNPTDAWTLFTPASGRLPMNAADFHPNFTHCDVFAPYHDRLFFEDLCYFNFLDQTLDPPLNDWYFGPHNLGRAGDSLIVWGRYLLDVIGFDEVRLDAVKHIEPGFLAPFLVELGTPDQPFAVGELFDGNLGTLVNYRNEVEGFVSNYGIGSKDANLAIFDFNLRYALRDMCGGGGAFPMHTLNSAGLYFGGGLPGDDVVTFVENHDVDRIGWQVVDCGQPHQQQVGSTCLQLYADGGHDPIIVDKEDMAYPFIMAAEGRPTVFWKDLFWYGLKDDIEWQMALREAMAKGTGVRGWNLGSFSPGADSTDVFAMARYGNSGGVNDGMVLVLNDNPGSERSVWVNTPFTNKYLKDYSDGYMFVTTQSFGDTRANVKAQSRDYAWWSVTGLYPKLPGTTGSHFQMEAQPGGCPHFIALRAADAANLLVNGAPIAVGDEVAVKNGAGDIVGIGRIGQGFQWDGVHDMIIEVLGAPSANGMGNGEQFSFVVYDASANAEVTIGYVQYATAGSGFTFSPDRPDSPNRNGNFSTFNLTATATGLYTCGGITRVLAFGLPVVPLEEQCGATSRADAGTYNDGLQNGDNDGSRFGAWTNVNGGANAGFFVGNSQNNGDGDGNGDGDINSGGEAWGFYANFNQTAEATRPFASALSIGQTFSIKMDNGWIQNGGTVGLVLQNGSGNKVWEFYFVGGNTSYTINDGNGANGTGISFTDEGLALEFLLTSSTTYSLKITQLVNGTVLPFTGPLITTSPGGFAIQGVRLFNFNAGGGGNYDAFFNSMQICDPPALVINEVDYDQVGTDDQEFIELRNMNTEAIDLDDFVLELVNGGDNSIYRTVNLPAFSLAAGDYYVICANGSSVPNCDFNFDGAQSNRIENGAPDGMRLLWNGVTVDALSYEGTVAGAGEGSGTGLEDSNTIPDVGLSRVPDGSDTDQNNVDFELTCITPGAANAPDNTDTDNDGAPDGCDDCPLAQNEGSIANFDIANCACDPGYFAVTAIVNGQEVITGCQECPPGSFCPDGINAYLCPAGEYQDQPGQTQCLDCQPGTYQSAVGAVSCINCPAGEYQDQPGQTQCLDCQPGTYQSAVGAVSCINCPAGEYQDQPGQTECLECLPGSYQSAIGATSCINCPAGEYQNQPGQTECLECLPGSYQSAIGATSCINCPAGEYQDQPGATACLDCQPGTYQSAAGATSCINCPAGEYQDQPGATACLDCQPGTYQSAIGATSCINCPAGEYQNQPGQTECLDCQPGTYQSAAGATSCINCPAGEYQDQPGQTECLDCQPGTYQSAAGATSCINCPPGTYTTVTAQTQCETCEPGTESEFSGNVSCLNCTPPSFSSCPPVAPVNNTPGLCEAPVIVPSPVLSGLCTRNHGLDFDGTNDYVDLGNIPGANFGTGDFTVEFWMMTSDVPAMTAGLISKRAICSFDNFWDIRLNTTGTVAFETSGAGGIPYELIAPTLSPVNDGQWHHLAVSRIGSTMALYLDGVLQNSATSTVNFSNTASVLIGADACSFTPLGLFYEGVIDEVRFWNVGKTQADILAAKDLEINSTYPGLIAFYNFNEGIACCDNTGLTTLSDGMGAYNGTLSGFSLASGCTSNWVAGAPALGDPLTLSNDVTGDCSSASGTYPVGTTTVTWTATGANGALETCVQTVTVEDIEAPEITCPASDAVDPPVGFCEYTISGTVYDPVGISDNCGINGTATYSVVGGSVSPASGASLDGAVLAGGDNVIEWSVTDVNGLTSTCQFTLSVTPCTSISGKLIWKGPPANTTTGVANATVYLSGDDSDTFGPTLADGNYSFTGFTGSSFTVKPEKTTGMFNGVNVGDATAIQVHLTGPPYVTDFFRLVAADVNKSNTISTLDATIIKQALLGNPAANNILNNTKSWRFISSSFAYPDPAGPFSLPVGMPETRSVTGPTTGQDFFGIKVGDFLETANPALSPMQMAPLVWRTADRKLQAGETLEATFTASNFEDIAAYQFALDFDPAVIEFQSLEVLTDLIPLTLEGNFGLFNIESGELRTLFSMLPGQTLPSKHPVFRLNFTVLESGQMLSEVLQIGQEAISALAFNTALDETAVELEFYQEITSVSETPAGGRKVVLLQNRPNPFDRETTIGFILPEACEAQLRVFDGNGREWWKTSKQYGAGYQEEILRLEHAGATGLLFCELTTPFGVVVGKMAMTGN